MRSFCATLYDQRETIGASEGKDARLDGHKDSVLFALDRTLIMADLNADSGETYITRLLGHQIYGPRFCTCLHVCTTSNVPMFMAFEMVRQIRAKGFQYEI